MQSEEVKQKAEDKKKMIRLAEEITLALEAYARDQEPDHDITFDENDDAQSEVLYGVSAKERLEHYGEDWRTLATIRRYIATYNRLKSMGGQQEGRGREIQLSIINPMKTACSAEIMQFRNELPQSDFARRRPVTCDKLAKELHHLVLRMFFPGA